MLDINKFEPIFHDKVVKEKVRDTINAIWSEIVHFDWKGFQPSAAYDTAWVGTVKNEHNKPLFPESIDWLLNNQSNDGSWGAKRSSVYICDPMLSTAAAIETLSTYDGKFSKNIKQGLEWINKEISQVKIDDPNRSVGFELLFPNLLLKLDKKFSLTFNIDPFLKMQNLKLDKLKISHIMLGTTPVLFSFEFLDNLSREIGLLQLDHQISRNGSIACSPSATAWYIQQNSKCKLSLLQYLKSVKKKDGGFPHFSDSELFTIPYGLYAIEKSLNYLPQALHQPIKRLKRCWTPVGVSFSEHFPVPDLDDSVLSLYLLTKYELSGTENINRHWEVLEFYKDDEFFKVYQFESGISHLVNIHVLDTLKSHP
ncbi:MAG: hypothetical protein ACFFBD_27230, partial [Candidatus Hodarchaeota archaeon]